MPETDKTQVPVLFDREIEFESKHTENTKQDGYQAFWHASKQCKTRELCNNITNIDVKHYVFQKFLKMANAEQYPYQRFENTHRPAQEL